MVVSTPVSLHPSRRAVLRAGLAVPLLAACTEGPPPGPPPPPDPDLALHAAAVAREQALVDAYDTAVLAAPALAAKLAAVRAEHLAHLDALEAADPAPPATASPSASPTASPVDPAPPSAPAPPPAPADPATVLARLVAVEAEAATAHANGAVVASRELAVVLATLAASEASHGVALA